MGSSSSRKGASKAAGGKAAAGGEDAAGGGSGADAGAVAGGAAAGDGGGGAGAVGGGAAAVRGDAAGAGVGGAGARAAAGGGGALATAGEGGEGTGTGRGVKRTGKWKNLFQKLNPRQWKKKPKGQAKPLPTESSTTGGGRCEGTRRVLKKLPRKRDHAFPKAPDAGAARCTLDFDPRELERAAAASYFIKDEAQKAPVKLARKECKDGDGAASPDQGAQRDDCSDDSATPTSL